jgi:hypothetical protein
VRRQLLDDRADLTAAEAIVWNIFEQGDNIEQFWRIIHRVRLP